MTELEIKKSKLWLGDNFKNWILKEATDKKTKVPEYDKFILPKPMNDYEILKERQIEPYSPNELIALLKKLIGKQPKGGNGTLLVNGYSNIFYVKLENERVVAVHVYWYAERDEWRLHALALESGWHGGGCVFSRGSRNLGILDLEGEEIEIKGQRYKLTKIYE